MQATYKECSTCLISKPVTDFHKSGMYYNSQCKICRSESRKLQRQLNIDVVREKERQYYAEHRKEECERKKQYSKENRDVINQRRRNRRVEDCQYRLLENMRRRLNKALRSTNKSSHTLELLGCDTDFLKEWIEFQFYDNMDWDNYGTYWHLDHCVPCAAYDLTNESEQKECFHWSNLRPYRADKNIAKQDERDSFQEMLQDLKYAVFCKLKHLID